jgi:hypothetical protein
MTVRKGANKSKDSVTKADCYKHGDEDPTKKHWIDTSLQTAEEFTQSKIFTK